MRNEKFVDHLFLHCDVACALSLWAVLAYMLKTSC
jgi:hypothetical protein